MNAEDSAAITLPVDATVIITTSANTQNSVSSSEGTGIQGSGPLTINGSGDFSVSGKDIGVFAEGITINAPITITATDVSAVISTEEIKLGSSVYIQTPTDSRIINGDKEGWYIASNSSNIAAKNVVIVSEGGGTGGDPTAPADALDFTTMESTDNSASAGWKWNKDSKTLTLSGATITANAEVAVKLPSDATIVTVENTNNSITSTFDDPASYAVLVEGAVTIEGSGDLTVSAQGAGLYTKGNITINAPITASCTSGAAISVSSKNKPSFTIDENSLRIEEPSGGEPKTFYNYNRSVYEGGFFAADGETIAKRVVIAQAPPTFRDGLGNNCTFTSYTKGSTNSKGYTFGGWFDNEGNELQSADAAVMGMTYTAKWTKDDKTVRTTSLDLTTISETNTLGATYANGVYTNTAEGWSWDAASKTLTLNGVIIDAEVEDSAAITLPGDASIIDLADGTKNIVTAHSEDDYATAISCTSALTIQGGGKLSAIGGFMGIVAGSSITINTPISASITGEFGAAIYVQSEDTSAIKIASSLSITKPAGGRVVSEDGVCIANSVGYPAKEVVIGTPIPLFNDKLGTEDCTFDTYKDGQTNSKGYTFAGWFKGTEKLTSASAAVAGTIYTAKWTKDGKTVRTTALDLSNQTTDLANDDEGWSWDATTKTLTLNGVTIDADTTAVADAAIYFDTDATIKVVDGTKNTVIAHTDPEWNNSAAICGDENLIITGTGNLTVSGEAVAIEAGGIKIELNGTLTADATNEEISEGAILIYGEGKIEIADPLTIKKPVGGEVAEEGTYIICGDNDTILHVVIAAPQTYTVTYNTNGGSTVASVSAIETHKLEKPTDPTKNGYTFLGWYKDAAFTNAWNFAEDTVTGNTTLYAKWEETAKTYNVSGTVYNHNNTAASGVTVNLMKGDVVLATATSGSDGTYTLTGIAPGVYNIVAAKGEATKTTLVTIKDQNQSGINVTMPNGNVSSELAVTGKDTPDVVVGGLDEEADHVKNNDSSATSVKVQMTVESKSSTDVKPTDKEKIEAVASGKTLEYFDINLLKIINDVDPEAMTMTNTLMEIVIPYDMSGKKDITVYRKHGDSAAALKLLSAQTGKEDGSYYLDTTNQLIYLYTNQFSTYAIGYNTQSGGSSSSSGSSSSNGNSISVLSVKNGTVSVSPKSASKGTTVTVTVTPDKGYVLETLSVTDASGKKLEVKDLGSGKYSFTMPAGKVSVQASFAAEKTPTPQGQFVDVPASAYYADAVQWAAEQKITSGTDATHFSPDGSCTRAQAVTFLWRTAGSPTPSAAAMPFTDVAADSYYYNAVLWAVENGITKGTSETTFSPEATCSRAQIVTFLWRSKNTPAAGTVNPFTDVSTDDYYADAVLWAVKENVTSGTTATTFSPDTNCTRAQIVTFLWRTPAK